jgi:hypothetical protein
VMGATRYKLTVSILRPEAVVDGPSEFHSARTDYWFEFLTEWAREEARKALTQAFPHATFKYELITEQEGPK